MRPIVVKDVFALRMRFRVHRCHANHLTCNAGAQVLRLPSRSGANAAALLKRRKKPKRGKRIVCARTALRLGAGAGIPIGLTDIG